MLKSIETLVKESDSITEFQRRVYLELLNVSAGQTITYGQLAQRIGCRSAQAVGQALRRNPFAVGNKMGDLEFTTQYCVPCHRVVASDGSLCGFHGHRQGPDIDRKRSLLAAERSEST